MYDNLCDYIHEETMELDRKSKGGKLSAAELQYADMLQHLKKSLLTNEAMEGAEGYSEARGDKYNSYGRSYMDGNSYARGRYAKRDSMGRYTRDDGIISELHELMEKAPEDKKVMFRRFISEMESDR
jgi:hypothetical protein